MKIIHCADLHLDSKLSAHLDKTKAKERRGELLNTFTRLVRYASDNGVKALLIAGDLFDTGSISKTTINTVMHAISENPDINFYYLEGNHDNDTFTSHMDELGWTEIPDNLKLFGDEWHTYCEADGQICISGVELNSKNSGAALYSFETDANIFNIVMLHGQESESSGKEKSEIINLNALRFKNIDYLALGHIHSYKKVSLDPRCTYCYPGCLEGRGFDECGEHGFVLLDIDEEHRTYTHEFVPFAQRRLYEVIVDVSGLMSTAQMVDTARNRACAEGCNPESMVKVVLNGEVDVECEKDIVYFEAQLKDEFYFIKVEDKTRLQINIDDYRLDESLKGEFVRQVLADENIDEEDKMKVIRFGLQALAGEEIQ